MTSRTNGTSNNDPDSGGGKHEKSRPSPRQALIGHAIEYSCATRQDRADMRRLLRGVDRVGQLSEQSRDSAVPPKNFIDQLRRPPTSRRRTITVQVDGEEVPILLNPQGRADPERELWLWHYVCNLIREGTAG